MATIPLDTDLPVPPFTNTRIQRKHIFTFAENFASRMAVNANLNNYNVQVQKVLETFNTISREHATLTKYMAKAGEGRLFNTHIQSRVASMATQMNVLLTRSSDLYYASPRTPFTKTHEHERLASNVASELLALARESPTAFSCDGRYCCMESSFIELRGVPLGRYRIGFDSLATAPYDTEFLSLRVQHLEGHKSRINAGTILGKKVPHIHPHMNPLPNQGGKNLRASWCLGPGFAIADSAYKSGRFTQLFDVLFAALGVYNADSPYRSIYSWYMASSYRDPYRQQISPGPDPIPLVNDSLAPFCHPLYRIPNFTPNTVLASESGYVPFETAIEATVPRHPPCFSLFRYKDLSIVEPVPYFSSNSYWYGTTKVIPHWPSIVMHAISQRGPSFIPPPRYTTSFTYPTIIPDEIPVLEMPFRTNPANGRPIANPSTRGRPVHSDPPNRVGVRFAATTARRRIDNATTEAQGLVDLEPPLDPDLDDVF